MGGRGSGGGKGGDYITVFQEIQLIQPKKEYEQWNL